MPFKDKVKQLRYLRNYQQEKRLKIQQIERNEKELQEIRGIAIHTMQKNVLGRRLYPVEWLKDGTAPIKLTIPKNIMPVIFKRCKYPSDITTIVSTVEALANEEDKLLLTGEHEGWKCLGIEGLATAKGRIVLHLKDRDFDEGLEEAICKLKEYGNSPPYAFVCSYSQLIKKKEEIQGYYDSPNLFKADGTQKNMLLVKVGLDNFSLLIGQDFKVTRTGDSLYFAETLVPVIKNPKAICEITWA